MPTFAPPHFSFDVNLGQVMLVGVLTLIGYGLKQIHKSVLTFIRRVDDTELLLSLTTEVVDTQTQTLIAAGILQPPVVRLHKSGRRTSDLTYFTRDNVQ